jgi:uncharacterized small protein (DUF1192 family)
MSPVAPNPAFVQWPRNQLGARFGRPTGCALQGDDMAKALFGHVGSAPDRRLLDEVTQLRAKVRALEFEVARLRAENDRLAAAASDADLLRLPEPALA